ncbi:hypothetical protein GLYMA_07G129400v4 [Glycine max]|uniref:tRNA-splicing endonuclease subunit Sen54 N-terminal domain-containing protein n=1 Tax=Glycine max TaxID=3847 RepID=A0A0R0J8Z7_SOYBN|nr:hypothetical protein GLYMA_07G129400v4 [Glycine max]
MEGKTRGCSSSEDSDGEIYLQNASDEEELGSSSGSMPKLQFRNVKSKGCWNEEMGMGEVIEKNGKMWITTGIVRSGKIYSSIEETLYLMELGALDIVDNDGRSISLTEMYEKVASGKSGCCWELFEVYRHLKSLGYIIGRHGVAWSLKSIKSSHKAAAVEVTEESKQLEDTDSKSELSINKLWVLLTSALRTLVKKLKGESIYVEIIGERKKSHEQCNFVHSNKNISPFSFLANAVQALVSTCHKLFGELQVNDLRPDFDVYLPNSRFRKSSPGDPSFLLYLSRNSWWQTCYFIV